MSEKALDQSDVDAFLNEQSRGGVPKLMWSKVRFYPKRLRERAQSLPKRLCSETVTLSVCEQPGL